MATKTIGIAGYEADSMTGRITGIIASGQNLTANTVVGKITLGAATVTPGGTNTGDATLTVAALLDGAKVGDYTITCITAPTGAGANNAVFSVMDPDGYRLADLTQAVAYTDDLSMTLGAASAADSIVGDTYTVTVAAGSGKYVAADPTAVDGSQIAVGILPAAVDASAADTASGIVTYNATYADAAIVWGAGYTTDAQKDAAAVQLAMRNITLREGV